MVNAKRVWRLYRLEGLQLRSKTPKRKVSAKLRQDRAVAAAPNEIWAMDFLSDQLCEQAWNRDPAGGVIGVQKGPL